MAFIVASHTTPADPEAYAKHYFDIHVPLAKALPGLRRYNVTRGPVGSPDGVAPVLIVAIMEFDSVVAIEAAFASEAGAAALADAQKLERNPGDIQILICHTELI